MSNIVQNPGKRFTLAILVEDKPTTLTRVAGLFARRSFNIHSLTVGPTEMPNISRITIVTDELSAPITQIVDQLRRLIHILKVEIMEDEKSSEYEICLVKINKSDGTFNSILQIINRFDARIVDETEHSMIIEVDGDRETTTDFINLMTPIGILELVKSGVIALKNGADILKNTTHNGENKNTNIGE